MRLSTLLLASAAMTLAGVSPSFAHEPDKSVAKSPPAAPYQQVSKLVKLEPLRVCRRLQLLRDWSHDESSYSPEVLA